MSDLIDLSNELSIHTYVGSRLKRIIKAQKEHWEGVHKALDLISLNPYGASLELEVSMGTIRNWLTGRNHPSFRNQFKLLEFLRCQT